MASRAPHPLIGRGDVQGQVRDYLLVPTAREVALLLLSGEEGIGKSILLRSAVALAREKDFLVLEGRAQALEIPQPFSLLHELFNSLVSQRKRESSSDGVKSLAELGLVRPGGGGGRGALPVAFLPVGMSSESPEERETRLLSALSRRESDREEEERELFDRMADHIEEVAGGRNILLAIDDLQNADHASIDFLGYLSRRARGRKIKIIATVRPESELPERVRDLLGDLTQDSLVHRLDVRRLDEQESRELLRVLTRGRDLPDDTVQEWIRVSHGNPLALEQLFRISGTAPNLATREAVSPTTATLWSLSEDERRGLSHASVLGRSFHFHLLYQTIGGNEERLAEVIDGLIRKGTLRESGEETYQFVADDLWNEVYRTMTDRRKRILHKKAALALESLGPGDGTNVYDLARHYFLAHDYAKAYPYNRQAAASAKTLGDHEAAVVYFDQAVQSLRTIEDHDRREEETLLVDLALSLDVIGEVDRAIRVLAEIPPSPLVSLHLAKLHTHAGRWKEAEVIIRDTVSQLDGTEDPGIGGMAYRMLGGIATYQGHYEDSLDNYTRAISLLVRAGLQAEAARARLLVADAKRYLSKVPPQEVEADYRRGIQELRGANDLSLLAPAVMNYGLWLIEAGRFEEALASLHESLDISRKAHNTRLEGWALFNMADVLLSHGDIEEADKLNSESRQKLGHSGDKFGLIQVHLTQARVLEQQHRLDVAEIEILEAFRLASEVGFEPDRLEVLFRQGEFFLLKGDRDGARKRMDELDAHQFDKMRPDLRPEIQRFREALKG